MQRLNTVKVVGTNNHHKVFLYTLSTCSWCRLTKKFLKENNIEYEYVDVDLASEESREEVRREAIRSGGGLTYPLIIIDNKRRISGFRKDEIKAALGI